MLHLARTLTVEFCSSISNCQAVASGVVGLTIETRNVIYG